MKPTSEDLAQLAGRLHEFLVDRDWTPSRQARGLTFFDPPQSLGIEGKFSIALPDQVDRPGVAGLLHAAADSLAELYGFAGLGHLLNKAASFSDLSGPTQLVARFVDDATTRRGVMPLVALAAYASNLEQGLYRSAKFKLGVETHENKAIAQSFVRDCLFLQTERGSFVARVEVPPSVLKQGDLFGGEPLASAEVCSSLFSAIQFINDRILGNEEAFDSPGLLGDAITLFDVEMLESLTKVVVDPEMETIDFSLRVGNQLRTSSTGWISQEKRQRLRDFLEFVRQQLRGEADLEVVGSIVELRSRDPEGNRNYIRVVSMYHGDRTFVSAVLSNEQYQQALDAHRKKRSVRLRGSGTRLKTQIRLAEVTRFVVL